jgi:SAM-dependent methyltransferase
MATAASPTSRKSKVLTIARADAERNAALLGKLAQEFPTTPLRGFSDLVHYAPSSEEPVHRWFPYREGYSTKLVEQLIRSLPKKARILDPFCGCGTTLLAAQSLGHDCVGFDVNPLAVLITRVKTREYSSSDIATLTRYKGSISRLTRKAPTADPPKLEIIDSVFHADILRCLLSIKYFIDQVESQKHREFLLCCWLSILEGVSNVYKEGNGIKYRNRRRTPEGYFAIPMEAWQKEAFPANKWTFVVETLTNHLDTMLDDAAMRPRHLPAAQVLEVSADSNDHGLKPNSIEYAAFSPPYCNCFNYFKTFKIELGMGGFAVSYADMQELNRRALRSHVETTLVRPHDEKIDFVDDFADLIDETQVWDSRIPHAVRGYFVDMKRVLHSLWNILKPAGRCAMVVGNSAYGGILIPTDILLAKIARNLGFEVESVGVARHLTTSSQQKIVLQDLKGFLRESLVILRKTDGANKSSTGGRVSIIARPISVRSLRRQKHRTERRHS